MGEGGASHRSLGVPLPPAKEGENFPNRPSNSNTMLRGGPPGGETLQVSF